MPVRMKVKELRDYLNNHTREDLELIAEKLYRLIPAAKRREKDVDLLVKDPVNFVETKKKRRKPMIDPEDVLYDAKEFLENANEGYYFAPNQIISKKERSRWRFAAKKIYQGLVEASRLSEYKEEASQVLEKMYLLFCKATGYHIFASTEPFQAMNVPMKEFLEQVFLATRDEVLTDDWVRKVLDLTAYSMHVEYYSFSLASVPLSLLSTAPAKEMALDLGKRLLNIRRVPKKHDSYIVIILFHLQVALQEVDAAIKMFKELSTRYESKERIFFTLLQVLRVENLPDEWIREYEKGRKDGIKAWSDMESTYQHLQGKGEFPHR